MAIENKLLVLAFGALSKLGFEVWIQKGCGLDRCFLSVFGIIAKFPWRKFDNISPYFRSGNPTALCLKCVIAHKILFLSSFHHENTAMGMPHFHSENLAEFWVWCAMAHQQGFMPVYMARAKMLMPGWVGALQRIGHIDMCRIHEETDVTWWNWSRQSHRMTWICTYNNCLDHILMSQGPKHSLLERVAHVSTRVHHTKCTITHTHKGIHTHPHTYIIHNAITQNGK